MSSAPEAKWHSRTHHVNGKTYPGNTMLRHCDEEADPFDPALDLFEVERIEIYPEVPVIGRNVTIAIFGTFKANVGVNATTWYLVDADHAGLVGWGDEEFCSRTTVLQATDGFSRDKCPPTAGSAVLLTDFLIEWYWPPGEWYVLADVRNDTDNEAARLFCIDGWLRTINAAEHSSL